MASELEKLRQEVSELRQDAAENRQLAEKLQFSEEFSGVILDSVMVGVIKFGPDGRIVYANRQSRQTLGLTDENISKASLQDFDSRVYGVDGRLLKYEEFPAVICMETLEPQPPMTIGFHSTTGQILWGVVTAIPVIDTLTRKLDGVVGTFVDVSHTRQIEEALRQSEERYRWLVDHAPDAIIVHQDGVLVYVNDAAVKLWGGKGPLDLLGRHILDFVHPRYRETVARRVEEAKQGKVTPLMEQLHVQLGGQVLRVEVTGTACVYAGKPSIQAVLRDVTERRRAERQVRRQRELLRKFFDGIPLFVALVDPNGTAKVINRQAREVLSWATRRTIRELFDDCCTDSEQLRAATKSLEDATAHWRDVKVHTRDGRTLDVAWAHLALSDGTSIVIGQDVTERKAAEQSLENYKNELEQRVAARTEQLSRKNTELQTEISERRRAEAELRKKQRFLEELIHSHERERQLIAYEIHDTMLQDVIGALMYIDSCSERVDPKGEEPSELLGHARHSLRRAIEEARRMISGLRPPIIDEQGIVAAIEYLINDAKARGLTIDFSHAADVPRLAPIAEGAVFRIVQEALKNLERHSDSTLGEVKFTTTGDKLRLEIRDWGKGFVPNQVGEGHYGLEGMQERARLAGGSATIHSAPGEGTQIVVEVPLVLAAKSGLTHPSTIGG